MILCKINGNMKDELISFETAKLAKEKGFKLGSGWQIRSLYNLDDESTFCEKTKETPEYACERCTQSLLQRWLREVHNIDVDIFLVNPLNEPNLIHWEIFGIFNILDGKKLNEGTINEYFEYLTYEQALEAGLYTALNLINK